jgi:hypothetical protein
MMNNMSDVTHLKYLPCFFLNRFCHHMGKFIGYVTFLWFRVRNLLREKKDDAFAWLYTNIYC